MKNKYWSVLKIILALFLIFGGVQHFLKPEAYVPFVPVFLPGTMAVIYVSGVLEIVFGIALFLKVGVYGGYRNSDFNATLFTNPYMGCLF